MSVIRDSGSFTYICLHKFIVFLSVTRVERGAKNATWK